MQDDVKLALEHAWRHFQLHAQQRISVFNFYVATASLLIAGLAFTFQAARPIWAFGVAAGILLTFLSVLFWKLDSRVSSIIKSSEDVMAKAEAQLISDTNLRTVSVEREMTASTPFAWHKAWTYGQTFRRIFFVMAAIGLGGAGWSLYRVYQPVADQPTASSQGRGDTISGGEPAGSRPPLPSGPSAPR
ncbi:MAG TPA: hypothetical protein VHY35_03135 [Stellaceae bacterium]|nr:hypothetical protein [Stellaceae bacterium]